MPAILDLRIYRGDTYQLSITYQDSDGNPIDLTGYKARAMWRTARDAEDTLITIDETSGITLGGAAGTADIVLTPAQTNTLTLASVWDFEFQDPSAVFTTILTGNVRSDRDISR